MPLVAYIDILGDLIEKDYRVLHMYRFIKEDTRVRKVVTPLRLPQRFQLLQQNLIQIYELLAEVMFKLSLKVSKNPSRIR